MCTGRIGKGKETYNAIFKLLRSLHVIFLSSWTILSSHQDEHMGSSFSILFTKHVILYDFLYLFSYTPIECKVVLYCSFICIFLVISAVIHFFLYLLIICIFFGKILEYFSHLLQSVGYVSVYVGVCMYRIFLYILHNNPLLNIWFTDIFALCILFCWWCLICLYFFYCLSLMSCPWKCCSVIVCPMLSSKNFIIFYIVYWGT
jgi:hypothetical protein